MVLANACRASVPHAGGLPGIPIADSATGGSVAKVPMTPSPSCFACTMPFCTTAGTSVQTSRTNGLTWPTGFEISGFTQGGGGGGCTSL